MTETIVNLYPSIFGERERTLVEAGDLRVACFRFDSGVPAVRLQNGRGEAVMLPFQGQQIWSARFGGRDLAMKTMFREPYPTQNYLQTYGGLLLHCGFTAMGVPSEQDTHPLHGELPNAPYQKAWLALGEDAQGPYVSLCGEYEHMVFFNHHYVAHPEARLRAAATLIDVSIEVTNLKGADMDLMYLAHVNFRPIDNGRLVYAAPCDAQHVRVRRSIPSHIHPGAGYAEFQAALAENPALHNVLAPGLAFDPEILFTLDYRHDDAGWSHSMQVHPDGSADYIAHRPDQLPFGLRWISRTPEHDSLGIVLPATAEAEGYLAERQKGNLLTLPANACARFDLTLGYLTSEEAASMGDRIAAILRT